MSENTRINKHEDAATDVSVTNFGAVAETRSRTYWADDEPVEAADLAGEELDTR